MKKNCIALVAALCVLGTLGAEERRPMDLVVVMDTSSSMFDYFRDISEYAVGPLLGEFMRLGDTFHLISFAGAPRTELSRRIEGRGDVETIAARMLLMYPLGPHSDVIAVLEYLARYLSDLPEIRPKTVVFISDGEHAPPPGSPYAGLSPQAVQERLASSIAKVRGNGWNFHILRVPLDETRKAAVIELRNAVARAAGGSIATQGVAAQGGAASLQTDPVAQSSGRDAGPLAGNGKLASPQGVSITEQAGSSAAGSADKVPGSTVVEGPSGPAGPLDVSGVLSEQLNAPIVEWVGGESSADTLTTAVGSISALFPPQLGKTGRSVRIPITVKNPSPSPVYLETKGILVDGTDRMSGRSFKKLPPRSEAVMELRIALADAQEPGAIEILVEPLFAGNIRIHPQSAMIGLELVPERFGRWTKGLLPLLFFLPGLGIAGLLALIILMVARRLHETPNRVAAATSGGAPGREEERRSFSLREGAAADQSSGEHMAARGSMATPAASDAALLASFASSGGAGLNSASADSRSIIRQGSAAPSALRSHVAPLAELPYEVRRAQERIMLSLFVEDQNTAIGRRNVHLIKAGQTLTIGGKRSDFLIFLVPIPHRIADLRFDGERCILVPRRPDFFPDCGAEPVEDCVGQTVRIISEKGYELKIRLDRYRDPLESLNTFLHSIELPG